MTNAEAAGFGQGAQISFAVRLNRKNEPQAVELTDASNEGLAAQGHVAEEWSSAYEAEAPQSRGAGKGSKGNFMTDGGTKRHSPGNDVGALPAKKQKSLTPIPDAPASVERYDGMIKKFWPEHKYGFIDCEELSARFGIDVYVGANQIGQHQVGSPITFRYEVRHGKPQAMTYSLSTPDQANAWVIKCGLVSTAA